MVIGEGRINRNGGQWRLSGLTMLIYREVGKLVGEEYVVNI